LFEFLGALGSIVLIDLVLSGDNALVIGAAAAGLPKKQRWYAIVLGGGGAIILRIVFAFAAALLLRLSLLQAIGGILLLLIAIRLLMDRSNTKQTTSARHTEATQESRPLSMVDAPAKKGFWAALLTILTLEQGKVSWLADIRVPCCESIHCERSKWCPQKESSSQPLLRSFR